MRETKAQTTVDRKWKELHQKQDRVFAPAKASPSGKGGHPGHLYLSLCSKGSILMLWMTKS